jgi:hypothetical protein
MLSTHPVATAFLPKTRHEHQLDMVDLRRIMKRCNAGRQAEMK